MVERTIKLSFILFSISNVMFIVLLDNSPDTSITASLFSDDVDISSASTPSTNLTVANETLTNDDKFYESLSFPLRIAIFSTTILTFLLLPFLLVRVMSSESRYLLNMSRKMTSNASNKYEENKTLTGNKTAKLKSSTDNTTTETTGKNKVKRVTSVKTNLKRTAPSIISPKKEHRQKDHTETTTSTKSNSKSSASNPLAVTSKNK